MPDTNSNNERGRPKIGFMLHDDYRRRVIELRLRQHRPGQYRELASNGYDKKEGAVGMEAAEADTIGYIEGVKPDVIYLEYNLHHPESATDIFRAEFFTLEPCRNRTFVLVTGTAIPEHVVQQLPRNVVTSIIGIATVDATFDIAFDEAVALQYESRNLQGPVGDGELDGGHEDGDDPEGNDELEAKLQVDVGNLIQDIGSIDGPTGVEGTSDPVPVHEPKRGFGREEPPPERVL